MLFNWIARTLDSVLDPVQELFLKGLEFLETFLNARFLEAYATVGQFLQCDLVGFDDLEQGGLPPEKWSSLMYSLWPDGGLKNGKEATHGGRDRHQAAAG